MHTYLVYFRNGKGSSRVKSQVWTRRIDFVDFENTRAIRIEQKWEDADTVFHTVTSYCDRQSFAPLYQDAWWKPYGHFIFNFLNGKTSVLGSPLKQEDTALYKKNILSAFEQALHQEVFNWHLDLEVFSLIPYIAMQPMLSIFMTPVRPLHRYSIIKLWVAIRYTVLITMLLIAGCCNTVQPPTKRCFG